MDPELKVFGSDKGVHAVWFYKKRRKISTSAVSYFGLEFQLVTVS